MRKTLLFFLILSAKVAFGQLHDDFSDGDWTNNPPWSGQSAFFTVNSDKQLKTLLNPQAQTVALSTANTFALNVKWEFTMQLNFDPSATNLARIYLISDQLDLTGPLNGYFVQTGEAGTADSYDLYRQTGTTLVKIIDGPPKNRGNSNFLSTKIKVTRDALGQWELYVASDQGASTAPVYTMEGQVKDVVHTHTQYFGAYCKYTATRSDGFIFDDFDIRPLVADTEAPKLLDIAMLDSLRMLVTFSEALDSLHALNPVHYAIEELNGASPVRVEARPYHEQFILHFSSPFKTGTYTLRVQGLRDMQGNEMREPGVATTFYIRPYRAKLGDVVINELMIDPSPSAGMPETEYVELWNTTSNYILLDGWKWKDQSSVATLKADTLAPKGYLILCARADTAKFKSYGKTLGISPWPSLNNDKDGLQLLNEANESIDAVWYQDSWYQDAQKRAGGFSLELIDPKNRCQGSQNWRASVMAGGGTPGAVNSVYQQQLEGAAPKIIQLVQLSDTTLQLLIDKPIDSARAITASYLLNNGLAAPIRVRVEAPTFTRLVLVFASPLTRGIVYELRVQGLCDCAGNMLDPASGSLSFFRAKAIQPGEVLISEIMNNPRPGGIDFVEIYNASDHVVDLSDLMLANLNTEGLPASLKTVSSSTLLMESNSYWVLSADAAIIKNQYAVKAPRQMVDMTMPAYPNEKGTVLLLSDGIEIDRFSYRADMHFPLLKQVKGVSLERSTFEHSANEAGNFKSAASIAGFATPTAKNSQAESPGAKNRVWLERKVFSPGGDNPDDRLMIHYLLDKAGYLSEVTVSNDRGQTVRRLIKNETMAAQGTVFWDGLDAQGKRCKPGIYILNWQLYDLDGRHKVFREVLALAEKW